MAQRFNHCGRRTLHRGKRTNGATNILRVELQVITEQRCPLEHIAQFANIPRPGVLPQQFQGLGVQFVLAAQLFEDRLAQGGQVIEAIAQRRHLDRQHIEPVIQVSTELAALDRRFKISRGRGDDPHIALDHFIGADRFEFLFL